MSDDTERLSAQVNKLTRERDDAYDAIRVAGVKARDMRADINRLSEDVRAMAAVLGKVAASDGVPDSLRTAARAALAGTHVEPGDTHEPDLVADIVTKFEAAMRGAA